MLEPQAWVGSTSRVLHGQVASFPFCLKAHCRGFPCPSRAQGYRGKGLVCVENTQEGCGAFNAFLGIPAMVVETEGLNPDLSIPQWLF